MKKETLKRDRKDPVYKEAVKFISILLDAKIPLACIDTNDWHCNTEPSVYVGDRRYKRLSKFDAKNAIKYFLNK